MISLTKAQVPRYLHTSAFYEGLADDNDEFCIPQENFKSDLNFNNAAELEHLFHTLRYWGLFKLPDKIIELLIFKSGLFSEEVLIKFDAEFQLLELYRSQSKFQAGSEMKYLLDAAISCGREDVLEYVYRVHGHLSASVMKTIAENGHVSLLKRVTDAISKLSERKRLFKEVSMSEVAANGHVECLRFLLSEKACARQKDMCAYAAAKGHLACLKLAHEHGCVWNKTVRNAAAYNGHIDCLKYTLEHGCPADLDAACFAAEGGQLECLQHLLDSGVKVRKRLCWYAAKGGNLHCLTLLRARGAPAWDANCARLAALKGHFNCLQYLLDEGCGVDESVTDAACRAGSEPCLALLLSEGCKATYDCVYSAAGAGSVECLKLLKEHNVPIGDHELHNNHNNDWFCEIHKLTYVRALFESGYEVPQSALAYAVSYGGADCVEFLCANQLGGKITADLTSEAVSTVRKMRMIRQVESNEHPFSVLKVLLAYNCAWDSEVCVLAAEAANVQLLAFAHERGCPWHERTCVAACTHVSCLECLMYAHENGCPWDARTVTLAVHYGLEDTLSYALTHGCPYKDDICLKAASDAKLPCLKLLHKHGCPWDERVSRAAARSGDSDVFRYCVENGCPIDEPTMKEYNNIVQASEILADSY